LKSSIFIDFQSKFPQDSLLKKNFRLRRAEIGDLKRAPRYPRSRPAHSHDHTADRTIWCRDDVVKELLHSLLGGFQKNCPQLFQDTWIFKILEKWS